MLSSKERGVRARPRRARRAARGSSREASAAAPRASELALGRPRERERGAVLEIRPDVCTPTGKPAAVRPTGITVEGSSAIVITAGHWMCLEVRAVLAVHVRAPRGELALILDEARA